MNGMAMPPAEGAAHDDIERHQHRQDLRDRQHQGAKGQGDDDTAEAGGRFGGEGQEDEQPQQQPGQGDHVDH